MNQTTSEDINTRQYLAYDSWLYQERIRNWSAYTTYCQYKQQQQATYFRIQQLQLQLQQHQYQHQIRLQQHVQQQEQEQVHQQQQEQVQQQQEQEQVHSEADLQSYIKEIDEHREEEMPQVSIAPAATSVKSTHYWEDTEKFQPTQEKKWRKDLRRDRRYDSKHVVEYCKQIREGIPPQPEVSRAENFNANKPPRRLRYESAQKRKTKQRSNQRTYGSGWSKQLE
jgi:hypothetical protein